MKPEFRAKCLADSEADSQHTCKIYVAMFPDALTDLEPDLWGKCNAEHSPCNVYLELYPHSPKRSRAQAFLKSYLAASAAYYEKETQAEKIRDQSTTLTEALQRNSRGNIPHDFWVATLTLPDGASPDRVTLNGERLGQTTPIRIFLPRTLLGSMGEVCYEGADIRSCSPITLTEHETMIPLCHVTFHRDYFIAHGRCNIASSTAPDKRASVSFSEGDEDIFWSAYLMPGNYTGDCEIQSKELINYNADRTFTFSFPVQQYSAEQPLYFVIDGGQVRLQRK